MFNNGGLYSVGMLAHTNNGEINSVTINAYENGSELDLSDFDYKMLMGMIVYENSGSIKSSINNLSINVAQNESINVAQNEEIYIGGIAYANTGEIYQCGNNGKLSGFAVGGIAVNLGSDDVATGSIIQCYNKGTMVQTSNSSLNGVPRMIGGIAVNMWMGTKINQCYVEISVTGTNTTEIFAGLVVNIIKENVGDMNIKNCFVTINNLGSVTTTNSYLMFASSKQTTYVGLGYSINDSVTGGWNTDDENTNEYKSGLEAWKNSLSQEVSDVFEVDTTNKTLKFTWE